MLCILIAKGACLEMRILIEQDNGVIIEAREIESVSPAADILVFLSGHTMKKSDTEYLEACLHEKTGKKCVVLPPHIEKVVGV